MTELLRRETLDGWLERWRARGVPYTSAWRPGLDDAAIAAIEREHGVSLPPELRTWWQWRDGTDLIEAGGRRGSLWVTPGIFVMSCEDSLRTTRDLRERVRSIPEIAGDWPYQDRWLKIGGFGNGDMVFADLQPSPAGASEIRSAWLKDTNDEPPPSAPSLGTLVSWWTAAIDSDVYWWDDERKRWDDGPEPVPEDQRVTGLV